MQVPVVVIDTIVKFSEVDVEDVHSLVANAIVKKEIATINDETQININAGLTFSHLDICEALLVNKGEHSVIYELNSILVNNGLSPQKEGLVFAQK